MSKWWGSSKPEPVVETEPVETLEQKRDRLGERVAVQKTELDAFADAMKLKRSEVLCNSSFEARDKALDELHALEHQRDALDREFQETITEWAQLPRG
jgi:hypothetical protein